MTRNSLARQWRENARGARQDCRRRLHCQVPIGAWGRLENGKLLLDVAVLSPDGKQRMWEKDSGPLEDADAIGKRVAQRMRKSGARELLERESRGTRA